MISIQRKTTGTYRQISKTAPLVFLLVFLPFLAISQQVPKQMSFGGIQLTFTDYARKQIQANADRLVRSPTYVNILTDRMSLYFPIIERILKEEKVPEATKFLVVQESGLISDAVSSANAVGFWQFKDFTAREMELTVDRRVDERLNIVSATKGAAKYLKTNNHFYNNWVYAVMAYNTGRGGAKKYINESLYGAKKMTIDKKTHWYIKKFLAHVVAFSPYNGRPHSENIWLSENKKRPKTTHWTNWQENIKLLLTN